MYKLLSRSRPYFRYHWCGRPRAILSSSQTVRQGRVARVILLTAPLDYFTWGSEVSRQGGNPGGVTIKMFQGVNRACKRVVWLNLIEVVLLLAVKTTPGRFHVRQTSPSLPRLCVGILARIHHLLLGSYLLNVECMGRACAGSTAQRAFATHTFSHERIPIASSLVIISHIENVC